MTKLQLLKIHKRAAERLHKWVEGQIEKDAVSLARLLRSGKGELLQRLRSIYMTYLGDDPSYVRARLAGVLPAMDRVVSDTLDDVTGQIYAKTRDQYTSFLAQQSKRAKAALRKSSLPIAEIVPTAEMVMNELNTSVVVGGTWADRLFHITDKIKGDIVREIRQGLFNKETFDDVAERVGKVFGVDRLSTPKSHAMGALKIYKNEARRQWNELMKNLGRKSEGVPVWFTMLDDSTTPGCAARHGFRLDDLDDDTMPHHPNCRCTAAIMPPDADLGSLQIEASAWLKAEGWSRKDAMFEEAERPELRYRALRETWESWPGLRTVSFPIRCSLAVVSQGEAEVLKLGRDPGVGWKTGDPRLILREALRDTSFRDPIIAVGRTLRSWRGLEALIDARSGAFLYVAREARQSDRYLRVSVLATDQAGKVIAVQHPDYPHWTLPGGHVERGEDPVSAAEREFGEETGRAVKVAKYLGEFELKLSTGEVANNMLYVGQLTGESHDGMVDPTEISDVKPVLVVDLDQKEREHIEQLWWRDDHEEKVRGSRTTESADVVHVVQSGEITASRFDGPRQRIVISAPHGSTDTGTGKIVDQLRSRLEVSTVVASGFDPAQTDGNRLNVNRPTEGISKNPTKGEDASSEKLTRRAAKVYTAWAQAVWQAAGTRPDLYVEIHDNDFESTQDHLEVATVGVKDHQAAAIKKSWESLDTSLGMKIEPLDELEWRGIVAKHIGIFKYVPVVVQVELPKKFCDLAASGRAGAIEDLEDWLEDLIQILTS